MIITYKNTEISFFTQNLKCLCIHGFIFKLWIKWVYMYSKLKTTHNKPMHQKILIILNWFFKNCQIAVFLYINFVGVAGTDQNTSMIHSHSNASQQSDWTGSVLTIGIILIMLTSDSVCDPFQNDTDIGRAPSRKLEFP